MSPASATELTRPVPARTYEAQLNQNVGWALEEGSLFFEKKGAVYKTLRNVTKRLEELGIPYAVCGGLALVVHGFRRFTEDVDILVTEDDLKRIHQELSGRGFLPPFERSKNLRDTETKVKVEFLITGQFPGDGKEKPVSFPNPTSDRIEDDGISYLGLNTLITLKLASGISAIDRAKDLVDVQELIKALNLPRSFGANLDPFVSSKFYELWDAVHGRQRRFITLWRNKWLTSDAKSIDEMIAKLSGAADELRAMKADGVVLDPEGGTSDDYAYLVTDNPAIAAKYGMEDERDVWGEEENETGDPPLDSTAPAE